MTTASAGQLDACPSDSLQDMNEPIGVSEYQWVNA